MAGRFVRTHRRRKAFLDELALGSSVSRAAMVADGTTSNFRAWRNSDPDFARDWDDAIEGGTDFLEDVATERAMRKSDPLMMMMLKARRPEKYDRGSKLELSGGISVEGSKSKLLNKVARLQAQRSLSATGGGEEQGVPEDKVEAVAEEATPAVPLLPDLSSIPQRGSKRRAASAGNKREGDDARRSASR